MTENLNEIEFELNVEELERIIAPGVATSPIISPPAGVWPITTDGDVLRSSYSEVRDETLPYGNFGCDFLVCGAGYGAGSGPAGKFFRAVTAARQTRGYRCRDRHGRQVDKGKDREPLSRITPSEIQRQHSRIGQRDALEIKQRRSDSLANGALIGVAVGGSLGALGAIVLCHEGCKGEDGVLVAGVVAVYAGIGTAIGVGIDALVRPRQTIYRCPLRRRSAVFMCRLSSGAAAGVSP